MKILKCNALGHRGVNETDFAQALQSQRWSQRTALARVHQSITRTTKAKAKGGRSNTCVKRAVIPKQNPLNAGWTSVDRSTEATLNTYNTWIQLSHPQKEYHSQWARSVMVHNLFCQTVCNHATGPKPKACLVAL